MIDPETQDLLLIDIFLVSPPETEIDEIWGPVSDIYGAGMALSSRLSAESSTARRLG
jgi:hypothetical protein